MYARKTTEMEALDAPIERSANILEQLQEGILNLPIQLQAEAVHKLAQYLQLLIKWNKTYNLTAVRNPTAMVTRHLLDSLAVLPYLPHGRILDVGSGAGLPGVPLAIANPHQEFYLIDSQVKKTRFLRQICHQLNLINIKVVHNRVERFKHPSKFTGVICRAFSSLSDFVEKSRHLCHPHGQFLALKGHYPVAELEFLPDYCELQTIHPLAIPGLHEQRHLVILQLKPPSFAEHADEGSEE
jgi:16S rRNA (guanine527-N7)-methyltransferase